MKNPLALLTLLSFSHPALAQESGPNYKIPRGATSNAEYCFTTELVRTRKGSGWSEWAPALTEDRHQSTYWNEGDYFYSLEVAEGGAAAEFSRFKEDVIDRTYTHRTKEVTKWAKGPRGWERENLTFDVSITKADGLPVRVTETGGGKSYVWNVRTYGDGDDQITERTLLNPSVLSTENRKVGSHAEHCRFRLTKLNLW
jgi:hypothetical protein